MENNEVVQWKKDACKFHPADASLKSGYWWDKDMYYYERGYSVISLAGPEDYSEYSKAIFGNEETLGSNPDNIYTFYGDGEEFNNLPPGVIFWRYLQSYHSGLPSMHDIITGFW